MKKNIRITLVLISLILISSIIYIYFSDNKNTEKVPKNILTLNFEFTNVFLIPFENGYILIDNAYEKELSIFEEQLNKYNIKIEEIKFILLTHHHDDHVGFANYLKGKNPNIRLVMHQKTSELIQTGVNNKNNGGGIINRRIYTLFKLKQLFNPGWDLSFTPYFIDENDIIITDDLYDLSSILKINLKVLYTPGHTSDSITYIYNDTYAFCGDLTSNFLNWAGSSYLTLFNEDLNLVYKSWKKLIDLDIEILLTAHGKAFNVKNLKDNLYKYEQKDIVTFF